MIEEIRELDGPICAGATNRFRLPAAFRRDLPTYARWGGSSLPALTLTESAPWIIEAARKLETLGSLRSAWDSYGGLPLSSEARSFTVRAMDWLGQEELPVPAVVLGSGGTVQLEWRGNGKELDVDLGEGKGIEFVTVDANGNIEEGRNDQNVPYALHSLARWFQRG